MASLGDGDDPGHFQGRGRSTWGREMDLAWGVLSAGEGTGCGLRRAAGGFSPGPLPSSAPPIQSSSFSSSFFFSSPF